MTRSYYSGLGRTDFNMVNPVSFEKGVHDQVNHASNAWLARTGDVGREFRPRGVDFEDYH